MNSLEDTKNRLEAALSRLDQAVDRRMGDLAQLRDGAAGQEDLGEAHAALKSDHEALKEVTEQTAVRLETAMARLGNVLDAKS